MLCLFLCQSDADSRVDFVGEAHDLPRNSVSPQPVIKLTCHRPGSDHGARAEGVGGAYNIPQQNRPIMEQRSKNGRPKQRREAADRLGHCWSRGGAAR